MEVSRKWQFHFFDDLASQRYYLPISSPPHREHPIRLFSRETIWKICFERGAKSIFRLSGENFSTDRYKGDDVLCLRRRALIGRWNIFQMAAEKYQKKARRI